MPLEDPAAVSKTRVLATDCPDLLRLGIEACGETSVHAAYEQYSRAEPRATLHICCRGVIGITHNGQKKKLFTGDFLYTAPGQCWHYYYADKPGHFLWLRLNPEQPLAQTPDNYTGTLHLEHIESAFSILYDESLGAARNTLIYHSAALLLNLISSQFEEHEPAQLSHMWRQVDQAIDRAWTLEDLAAIAKLGRERLRQLCMRAYGHAPMQHLSRLRMRRACQLLEEDRLSVEGIAQRVGYENAFAFSRAFKRLKGKSPRQWRDAH